nr:immunoglobulin heavy chain junction region [Mus musculus]
CARDLLLLTYAMDYW